MYSSKVLAPIMGNYGRDYQIEFAAIVLQCTKRFHANLRGRKPSATDAVILSNEQPQGRGATTKRHVFKHVPGEEILHGRASLLSDPNSSMGQWMQRTLKFFRGVPYRCGKQLPAGREELVVLGSGWASLYFLSQIDPTRYNVTVISPRPYFVFTPLLTAALGGVQSLRSIMEPIRNKMRLGSRTAMKFVQGTAVDVDLEKQEVECCALGDRKIKVPYQKLIVAVGSETNTFGIPGVKEHCSFLKEIEDVREIRLRLFSSFEKASQPNMSEEDKKKLLSFVVVGGGPAGVEAAAEMNDLIKEDIHKYFPDLVKHAKVTIIEMLPKLLPMFDESISVFAKQEFERTGIRQLTGCRVTKIDDDAIHLINASGNSEQLPYSFCLWASGVGQVELAKKLMTKIPQQKGNRVMRVDPTLQVIGGKSVYALGDCAWVTPPRLSDRADELYNLAKSSVLGPSPYWLKVHRQELLRSGYVQLHTTHCDSEKISRRVHLSLDEFKQLLEEIDKGYHPPIPTAQMARQAGSYMGAVLNQAASRRKRSSAPLPWAPRTYGAMSYIGDSKAIVELTKQWNSPKPRVFRFMGSRANLLWHSYYWTSQTSPYNRILSLLDYAKKCALGRDVVEQSLTSTATRSLRKGEGVHK